MCCSPIETSLRAELAAVSIVNPALLQKVRVLIADSDRKQQNELALRLAALYTDVQSQRASDLAKIDRSLFTLSNTTGLEVRRQNESIRSLGSVLAKTVALRERP